MKPSTLLISAILLSSTGFAQTTLENQESVKNSTSIQGENGSAEIKSSGSASSATSSESNAVNNAELSTHSSGEVKKNNKISENAYLISDAGIGSSTGIKNNGNQLKESGKSNIGTSTALAAKNINQVKTGVNKTAITTDHKMKATSATTIRTGSANSFRPGAAFIKMNTHMKANNGIRIK